MRNRHPGTCYRCGQRVEPGDGHFERLHWRRIERLGLKPSTRWITQHAECAIRYRGTDFSYANPVKLSEVTS